MLCASVILFEYDITNCGTTYVVSIVLYGVVLQIAVFQVVCKLFVKIFIGVVPYITFVWCILVVNVDVIV